MLPGNLRAEHFAKYPPQAKKIAIASLSVFRQLPLSFLPSLLREVIEYDSMFPAERFSLDKEMALLGALSTEQMRAWFQAFSQIRLESSIDRFDWVDQPARFIEQLSAVLWSTHQLDAFRNAATVYNTRIHAAALPAPPLPVNRLGIAVIGRGVASSRAVLFRKLRRHGTYFTNVDPDQGFNRLLAIVEERARAYAAPYGHWYVDGGTAVAHSPLLTSVSYENLALARELLLKDIEKQVQKAGMGPEELHSHLARLLPADLGMSGDTVLDRFQIKLLTEGSGTQIFSTTFAQWATREALRRAEPLTLLVRFAPRQRERQMNELLSSNTQTLQLDPIGSLIDADIAAYYHFVNQQRLAYPDRSAFIVWFEDQHQAVGISPSMPRGVESTSNVELSRLCFLVTQSDT